jgi:signal transduction histidine kinase/HAMP domain-containing protein
LTPLASVQVRIVTAFLAAVVTMAFALVFLMVQNQGVFRTQALITEGYLPLTVIVDQIEGDKQRVDTDIERMVRGERRPLTGNVSSAASYGERMRGNLLEARVHARQAQQMARGSAEIAALNKVQQQLGRIEELIKEYQVRTQQLVEEHEREGRDAIVAESTEAQHTGRELGEEVEKLKLLLDDRIQHLNDEIDRQRARANAIAATLASAALLSSMVLLVAVLVALRPIGQLTEHVQRLARGERPAALDVKGENEVALLAREFDRMVEALRIRDERLTERAEQLDRLSRYLGSVLDSLEDGLFVVEGGLVKLANPAAARLWSVLVDAPAPEVVQPWLERIGLHEFSREGSAYEARSTSFGSNGIIVVVVDVTDQRRALDRVARSERLAWIGQMLAQITHEVRNPLNAMSLNAEMLGDELARLDPQHQSEAHELLGTVSGEIERLTAVTGHYLQLARRPAASLAPERVDELVSDVVRLLQAELAQAGVELVVTLPKLGPQLVDGNQLRQALLNVIRNAVEAGARHLRLVLHAQQGELQLTLVDDGAGMTNEEQERAFDPFYSTKAHGTGLGLAITRQILEDHDGTIRVTTSPGAGTTLTLVLPERPVAS